MDISQAPGSSASAEPRVIAFLHYGNLAARWNRGILQRLAGLLNKGFASDGDASADSVGTKIQLIGVDVRKIHFQATTHQEMKLINSRNETECILEGTKTAA